MSKYRRARAVLAGAAILVLAGCVLAGCRGVPTGARPDVPGEMTGSTARPDASSVTHARSVTSTHGSASSGSFVQADSIPFPVAVGNTWVYRMTAGGAAGRTTNTIVWAGPGQDGYQVTMSSTTDVAGTAATVRPVYVFYPDGTVGYPVPPVNGVSVAGVVRWPDAATLASGRAYHSALRAPAGQDENANVIVRGAGTTAVSVPAGAYRASVVDITIATKVGTIEVRTWIAQGTGPVKTVALIRAAGTTEILATSELLSFTKAKGAVAGIGS